MTDRLADISARIEGIRQLGLVVNAMKGIAASRAMTARGQVAAVDSYAASIAAAMVRAIGPGGLPPADRQAHDPHGRGLLVFCAEQGFAGAFSERVLDSIGDVPPGTALFLVGTRGIAIAAARGLVPAWTAALPAHAAGIPKLADAITRAIHDRFATRDLDRLDLVFTGWQSGRRTVQRQTLFPIDPSTFPPVAGERPLTQIRLDHLLDRLGMDYVHALLCKAALHAFAAENEARMEAMSAAGNQIERELATFEATLRRVRQEAITAEIIELGTVGAARSR